MSFINKFYKTKDIDKNNNEFDLRNLGESCYRGSGLTFVYNDRIDRGESYFSPPTQEDYDRVFFELLLKIKPVYRVDDCLNYHFNYFLSNYPDETELFFKHMEYVILPKVKRTKRYELGDLIALWINNKNKSFKKKEFIKSIDQIAELILDRFRKTNCRAGHIVMMRDFRFNVIPKLNPKEQDLFFQAANKLIEEGYITYENSSPECFRLTEKGFNYIYDDKIASHAEGIIKRKLLPSSDFPDAIYKDVIKTLTDYGKDLEKKPSIYLNQPEEGLRDHFLTNLTGRYEKTTATGESFNKSGKTDILLKDDKGNNLFIAECKWWTGAVGFLNAIDQLFDNYISWRDTKLAIIFFVANKDFTNVLDQIEDEAKKHKYFIQFITRTNKSNFSFIFRQKDDEKNKVMLEILFFHFPD